MAFARPTTTSKPPGNTARGKSGSSATRQPKPKPATHSRPTSVSSTSSEQSRHSRASGKHVEQLDASQTTSRPPSVCSSQSGSDASESPLSTQPQSSAMQPSSSVNSAQPEPNGSSSTPQPTTDSLQVAAQLYPWLYMTSTLDACFKSAETAAEKDLAAREAEVAEEESEVSDQRVRLEAERKIEFYQELSTDKFATAAPTIMQAFIAHGDACTALEAEALQLATGRDAPAEEDYYSPMRPYNTLLDKIEEKQREQRELHASIVALTQDDGANILEEDTDQASARTQLVHVFSACLPVLHARAANLQMAHELLEGAKENLAMSIHLESLEVSESNDE